MRAVIQRVKRVNLTINNLKVSKIDKGLLVLLAIEESDKMDDILWLSKKIVLLRIFNDADGVMNKNVQEIQGNIMVVSQFTLLASTKKGNRPSYTRAAREETANKIYKDFINQISKDFGQSVKAGKFKTDMQIELINDGPVTIIIDTKNKE
jgi:D-tyrosyl-tRNA(Tyr) deacylase